MLFYKLPYNDHHIPKWAPPKLHHLCAKAFSYGFFHIFTSSCFCFLHSFSSIILSFWDSLLMWANDWVLLITHYNTIYQHHGVNHKGVPQIIFKHKFKFVSFFFFFCFFFLFFCSLIQNISWYSIFRRRYFHVSNANPAISFDSCTDFCVDE